MNIASCPSTVKLWNCGISFDCCWACAALISATTRHVSLPPLPLSTPPPVVITLVTATEAAVVVNVVGVVIVVVVVVVDVADDLHAPLPSPSSGSCFKLSFSLFLGVVVVDLSPEDVALFKGVPILLQVAANKANGEGSEPCKCKKHFFKAELSPQIRPRKDVRAIQRAVWAQRPPSIVLQQCA